MNKLKLCTLAANVVLAMASFAGADAFAQNSLAQPAPDSGASMVKPPDAASGGSNNPDNMPVKKPRMPTNDKMMRNPPASAANAK
jgi:hypothetical protein